MTGLFERNSCNANSSVFFVGFALSECVVQLDWQSAKYLRAVHRTALELAVHNRFGVEIGGFWLLADEIEQLRNLSEHYPPNQAAAVARTVEAYLKAQLQDMYHTMNSMPMQTTTANGLRLSAATASS
jgi:hypothetical protein